MPGDSGCQREEHIGEGSRDVGSDGIASLLISPHPARWAPGESNSVERETAGAGGTADSSPDATRLLDEKRGCSSEGERRSQLLMPLLCLAT